MLNYHPVQSTKKNGCFKTLKNYVEGTMTQFSTENNDG